MRCAFLYKRLYPEEIFCTRSVQAKEYMGVPCSSHPVANNSKPSRYWSLPPLLRCQWWPGQLRTTAHAQRFFLLAPSLATRKLPFYCRLWCLRRTCLIYHLCRLPHHSLLSPSTENASRWSSSAFSSNNPNPVLHNFGGVTAYFSPLELSPNNWR